MIDKSKNQQKKKNLFLGDEEWVLDFSKNKARPTMSFPLAQFSMCYTWPQFEPISKQNAKKKLIENQIY